jgi:AraC-like DNA-binding protein
MDEVINLKSISELNSVLNQEKPRHPLVSVIDFSKVASYGVEDARITSDFYSIMLKNHCHGKMKYGRAYYDFEEGTLICIAPRQVITIEQDPEIKDDMNGWGLFFHPDLIRDTALGKKIKDYTFFSYEMNEALHLSDKEKQVLNDCILKIDQELSEHIDKHSQMLIVSNIELLLNYCSRYYDRQFITRSVPNKDILVRFEQVVQRYLGAANLRDGGLPTVKYCADQLFLSPNYLSDLLKKETGKNAQDHIHYYIIEEAKNSLLSSGAAVSEIAYGLGFEYPQYFSKLFKAKTGMTPAEFRNMN